uniref:Uncharacterized protein n=1 Tax=Anguilla anguilla TaxID=7936 RepID=A0A0E9R1A2_ANGAN
MCLRTELNVSTLHGPLTVYNKFGVATIPFRLTANVYSNLMLQCNLRY